MRHFATSKLAKKCCRKLDIYTMFTFKGAFDKEIACYCHYFSPFWRFSHRLNIRPCTSHIPCLPFKLLVKCTKKPMSYHVKMLKRQVSNHHKASRRRSQNRSPLLLPLGKEKKAPSAHLRQSRYANSNRLWRVLTSP